MLAPIVLIFGMIGLTVAAIVYLVLPGLERPRTVVLAAEPDAPKPFGPSMAWIAVRTQDTARVANLLGLAPLLVAEDACYKIFRKFTVINWCTYDPQSTSGYGKWTHTPIIKVLENAPPTITDCTDKVIGLEADCKAAFTIKNSALMTPDVHLNF